MQSKTSSTKVEKSAKKAKKAQRRPEKSAKKDEKGKDKSFPFSVFHANKLLATTLKLKVPRPDNLPEAEPPTPSACASSKEHISVR